MPAVGADNSHDGWSHRPEPSADPAQAAKPSTYPTASTTAGDIPHLLKAMSVHRAPKRGDITGACTQNCSFVIEHEALYPSSDQPLRRDRKRPFGLRDTAASGLHRLSGKLCRSTNPLQYSELARTFRGPARR